MRPLPTPTQPPQSLVVIGNFDGVHRGHQAVLSSAVTQAQQLGLVPLVLTFHPHPAAVLGKRVLKALTPLATKIALIEATSPSLGVVVLPFTLELSALLPEQFVQEILLERLAARVVLVGENFRFGRGRSGDLACLVELGNKLGFVARAEHLVADDQGAISSTRIRKALELGDVETARRLLGRPHRITGQVVHGDHRGTGLGFPTANLDAIEQVLPQNGVYAGWALQGHPGLGEPRLGRCVVNVGARPTVDRPDSVEVHILDYAGDLYGSSLSVDLGLRLRSQRKFGSLDELTRQIGEDVATAGLGLVALEPSGP